MRKMGFQCRLNLFLPLPFPTRLDNSFADTYYVPSLYSPASRLSQLLLCAILFLEIICYIFLRSIEKMASFTQDGAHYVQMIEELEEILNRLPKFTTFKHPRRYLLPIY